MQTDLAIDPAGNVWVMNNWQDIDSCIGTPTEAVSTRCGGQGVGLLWNGKAGARAADRPSTTTTVNRMAQRKLVGPCPCWVLCHEHRRSKRRCATVREMKEGPSGSAIRSLIPSHRELLRSKAMVVSVAEMSGQ